MDEWDQFWDNVEPGTVFKVSSGQNSAFLVAMKPSESHHTKHCLFNTYSGTIHHYSEFFSHKDGLDNIKSNMWLKNEIE